MNILALILALGVSSLSARLPNGFQLDQNSAGELLLKNSKGVIVIQPQILAYGHNKDYFIACIENANPQMELKRYAIVNFSNDVTIDTVNLKNWMHFLKEVPELGVVDIRSVNGDSCP